MYKPHEFSYVRSFSKAIDCYRLVAPSYYITVMVEYSKHWHHLFPNTCHIDPNILYMDISYHWSSDIPFNILHWYSSISVSIYIYIMVTAYIYNTCTYMICIHINIYIYKLYTCKYLIVKLMSYQIYTQDPTRPLESSQRFPHPRGRRVARAPALCHRRCCRRPRWRRPFPGHATGRSPGGDLWEEKHNVYVYLIWIWYTWYIYIFI